MAKKLFGASDEVLETGKTKVDDVPTTTRQSRPVKTQKKKDTESEVEVSVSGGVYTLSISHISGAWADGYLDEATEVYGYGCTAFEGEISSSGEKSGDLATSRIDRDSAGAWMPESSVFSTIDDALPSPCEYVAEKLQQ